MARWASRPVLPRPDGSGERHALDSVPSNPDCLHGELEAGSLGMRRTPRPGSRMHAACLLLVDHLERVSEGLAALLLDLDDEKRAAASKHEIELVPTRVDVRIEKPVPPQSVVSERAPLATVHAAQGLAYETSPTGGSPVSARPPR